VTSATWTGVTSSTLRTASSSHRARLRRAPRVNDLFMIGAAFALLLLGVILLFLIPWVGIPVAIVGIVLLVLYAVGFGRRAATRSGP
jgi:Flp pilus assembly protein TadB